MYARICSLIALLLAGLALSECASYAPYPCPPGYHLGPYGRRCLPNVGAASRIWAACGILTPTRAPAAARISTGERIWT